MTKPFNQVTAKANYDRRQAEREEEARQRQLRRQMRINSLFYEYTEEILKNKKRLLDYLNKPTYCMFSEEHKQLLRREMLESDAPFLALNNPHARFLFYPAWVQNIIDAAGENSAHLVTLVRSDFVFPLSTARNFRIRVLKRWTRKALAGFDFVGMVEVAHYSQPYVGVKTEAHISFHVHAIVLGANADSLRARVANINERFDSLLPDCPAVDMRTITQIDIPLVARYLAKEANRDYRVYPMKRQIKDALAGDDADDFETEETGRASQADKRMTSGPQYRVREVTRGMHLDNMVLGGGTVGEQLAEKIVYDALRTLPHSKRRGREAIHSGCFEPPEDAPYVDKYTGFLVGMRPYQPGDYKPTFPPLPSSKAGQKPADSPKTKTKSELAFDAMFGDLYE